MTIEQFNERMGERDLCVLNMGGIDNQTLAGAISTGTHGTGLELPAFHGMVRSLALVASGGRVYRIEPSAGLVDRQTYQKEGVDELIRDDYKFHSTLIGLGCMGIVYSYILELQPIY